QRRAGLADRAAGPIVLAPTQTSIVPPQPRHIVAPLLFAGALPRARKLSILSPDCRDRGYYALVPARCGHTAAAPGCGRCLRSNHLIRPGAIAMRLRTAVLSLVLLACLPVVAVGAEEAPPIKGLFLLTDYP